MKEISKIKVFGLIATVALILIGVSIGMNIKEQRRYNGVVSNNVGNIKFNAGLISQKPACNFSEAGCNWLLLGNYESDRLSVVMRDYSQNQKVAFVGKQIYFSDNKSIATWNVSKHKGFSVWLALDPQDSNPGLVRYRRLSLVLNQPYDYNLIFTQKEFDLLKKVYPS